jgi:HAD superfamily hydrolase (TIGR01450 family)
MSRATAPAAKPLRDATLGSALAGVRAFVLDADGVLLYRGRPIEGSVAALQGLKARGIPYRVVTNYSSVHRTTLAAQFSALTGLPAEPELIITAASAAAAYTAKRHAGGRLLVLASPDAAREWAGQQLVSADDAGVAGASVDVVVIGDAGDDLSFRNLDLAFRHIRAGAAFVAMHRNPWWIAPTGLSLDAGSVVAGLEFATGRRAVVGGKPSPVVFREALRQLRSDVSAATERPLRAADVAMVGDDPRVDVAAAQRVGLRGILVLSGKLDRGAAIAAIGRTKPDAIAADLAEVVSALG